jgi:Skp family chaperone for outer membrane proteins
MKKIRFWLVSLILPTIFAAAALAQQPAESKVALVNTDAFYLEKGGLKKIADTYGALNLEFKATFDELENLSKRFETLQNEVKVLQQSKVPVKPEILQAKVDEAEKLQRDFKFKQEDAKARYEKREAVVLQPVIQDVGKSIGDYAKQKGYTLVLDSGKLSQARVLLFLNDAAEVTADFIKFYNARPAGTASTTPK